MTRRDLPEGVSYQHRPDRPNRPHRFGAYDQGTRRYKWATFADYGKGLAWAKGERRSIQRGAATSQRAILSEVGAEYLERLESQAASASYRGQMKDTIEALVAMSGLRQ